MLPSIKNLYYNLSFKYKLLVTYITVFILSFVIMNWFAYSYTSSIVEEKTISGLMQAFGQMKISISSMITEIENISEQIYMNSILQKIVDESYGNDTHYNQFEDYRELVNFISTLEQNPNIDRIEIYLKSNSVFSQDHRHIYKLDSPRARFFSNMLEEDKANKKWLLFNEIPLEISYGDYDWLYSRNNDAIFFVLKIRKLNEINNECGLVVIKINQSKILDMMGEIDITENIKVCLINDDGVVIHRGSDEPFLHIIDIYNIREDGGDREYSDNHEYLNNYVVIESENIKYLSFIEKIPTVDWYLRGLIPKNELMHEGIKIRNFLISITVATCLLTAIISLLIAKNMSKNINIIVQKMENIDTFSTGKEIHSKDEIGKLEDHFIRMVYTLKSLIKENYEVKIQKNEAEFRALQAQINPHFLYNTLDCINWLALVAKEKTISKAVTYLSRFLRYSLSRDDTASIGDEIEHIKIYEEIQNIRFDNCINIYYEIHERFYEYLVPRLTFQPLVENSIIHGFKPQIDGKSEINIWIICTEEDNKMIIYIKDDGIGISESKLQQVFNEKDASEFPRDGKMKGSGYGLSNIRERLRLYYGEGYGLEIFNNSDKGACVKLILPHKSKIPKNLLA